MLIVGIRRRFWFCVVVGECFVLVVFLFSLGFEHYLYSTLKTVIFSFWIPYFLKPFIIKKLFSGLINYQQICMETKQNSNKNESFYAGK